eukprot:4687852-Ditylum_brightwellii.AAC.1
MAGCSKGVRGTECMVATEATEFHLRDAAEDLVQPQVEMEELNACCTTLNTMRICITPVKLFQSEFVKLDGALAGHTIAMLICGGIFKDKNQDKAPIIPWSSTDPDSKIIRYSWPEDDSRWQIPRSQHFPGVKSI